VLDCVLHKRLQNHPGDFRVQRFGIDLEAHAQPILKARLLYFQILLQELELLLQRHAGRA
jgi:hypothetical protein